MMAEHRSAFSLATARRTGFYVVIVGALGLYAALLGDLLPLVATAWFVDVGPHRLHDLNFLALVWLAIFGLVAQLYRPDRRVTAAVVPLLVMAPLAIFAVTSGSPIALMPVLFSGVGLAVAVLHPAGRSLLRVDRVAVVDRGLVGLLAVAAVPLLVYAVDQLQRQYAVTDDHAALVHYGGMALVAAGILVLGTMAAVRERDWRFAAWGAGALAAYLGASSFAFPDLASSAGPVWGGLSLAWGVLFVAAVETVRSDREPSRVESSTILAAAPETVWALINDFDRMPEWVAFADELTYRSDGPVGEGTIYREYGGVGPIRDESEWRIVAFEPPNRQVHEGDLGVMRPTLTMELDPVDGGTRFTQTIEFRALPSIRPVGRLLEMLFIRRAMRTGLRRTQLDLGRLLEAEG